MENNLTVLRVHNWYKERGGEDSVNESEIAMLRKEGLDVQELIFSNDEIPNKMNLWSATQLSVNTIWSNRGRRAVKNKIEMIRPDIVHFDNTFPLISPAAYGVVKRAGIPTVQTVHNFRMVCVNGLLYRNSKPCLDCVHQKLGFSGIRHRCYRDSAVQSATVVAMNATHKMLGTWNSNVDLFIAPTELVRRILVQSGLTSTQVVVKPHAIPDLYSGSFSQRNQFLLAGRLVDYKGVDLVMEAWSALSMDAPLKIVGDGPMSNQVEEWAANRDYVSAPGRLSRADLIEEMEKSMAVIVASKLYETFGLSIVEAFSTGTPVIAARHGAMEELVSEGVNGLLFRPGDSEDLRLTVRWAAGHPDEMRIMGENARNEYLSRFTPDHNARTLIGIYEDLLAAK